MSNLPVQAPAAGGLANPVENPLGRPEGLEDFGTRDQIMPILRIDHPNVAFEDSLSGAKYSEVTVVLLGLIKQRVLWPPNLQPEGSGEQPLCRSYNFTEGHPVLIDGKGNADPDRFPWAASGFSPITGPLPCASCKLKDWGSHPNQDKPWCSEQHSFGLLMPGSEPGTFVPCLFQLQRSGLKPSRQYLSSFANSNQPLFTVWTKITLETRKMGTNTYAVPKFMQVQATDAQLFPQFSASYRGIRDFLQTPRRNEDEGEDDAGAVSMGVETPEAAVIAQPEAAPVAAAPAPAPVAEPTPEPAAAAPAPAPAPGPAPAPMAPQPAPAPAAAPAPAQTAPTAAPAPGPAPAGPFGAAAPAPAAPVAAPVAAAPAAPVPASPVVPDTIGTDEDELPF